MCSRKCERPASASVSPREPAPTKKPRAADRTEGMTSVTIRSPESSSVRRCSGNGPLGAVRVPVRARAALAAAPAVAVAPAAAAAVTARPAVAAVAAPAAAAGADRGQLLDGLAGDLGVLGEAEADPAALAVDLDHAHLDLVALVEDLLHGVHPLAGRDVGDVEQAVRALGELDEGAERRRLDDLAGELVADRDLLGHRADAVHQGVALGPGRRVDEDLALVVDVDLRLELLRQATDRLAALADEQADLVGVDLDRRDARRVLRQLRARRVDDLGHLAEDERPPLLGLRERVAQDVEGHARDLDVHLEGGDAVLRAGDLEVHVAEVVLHPRDVGQDDVLVALLDEAHGDARDGVLERHAGVHQRQRGAAHGGHGGRPVRLEDVRDDADRVGELLLGGDHRDERPLGERAVADVTPLRAAHEARLPDREGREVVVVEVALGGLQPERVEPHLLARGAERGHRDRLRLAAREQRGAMRARQQAGLDGDLADLVGPAAVGAALLDRDALADDRLLEPVEGELRLRAALGVLGRLGVAGVLREDLVLDRLGGVLAGELVLDRGRLVELLAVRALDLLQQALVDLRDLDLELGRLAGLLAELAHRAAELLDLRVGDVQRVEDLGLGDLVRPRLDHQDGLLGARDHEVEVGREQRLLVRVDDEVALDLADPHGADRHRERDVGDHQGGGGAVHGQDVVGHDVVDRERDGDELRLAVPALGEERAQGAVDHAGDQGPLLAGAALALEERAGDLARGVHALLDVHSQREEVDVTRVAGGRGAQHHRLTGAHDDGSGGLLGQAARLERDLGSAYLDGDPMHFRHMFLSRPRFGTRVPLHLVDASVLLAYMVVATDTLATHGRPDRRLRGNGLHGPAGGGATRGRRGAARARRPLARAPRRARGAARGPRYRPRRRDARELGLGAGGRGRRAGLDRRSVRQVRGARRARGALGPRHLPRLDRRADVHPPGARAPRAAREPRRRGAADGDGLRLRAGRAGRR